MIKNRIALDEYIHSRFLYERILVDRYGSTDKYLSYYAEEKSDDTFRVYRFPKSEWTIPGGHSPLFEYVIFKFHDYVPFFSRDNRMETKCFVYMFSEDEIDRFANIERYFLGKEDELR